MTVREYYTFDWSERCSTPAGKAGKLRPHRAQPEEAQLTPRGKRAPAAEISDYSLMENNNKVYFQVGQINKAWCHNGRVNNL